MEDYIMHVGVPHEGPIPHSGRFPWGSGDAAFQRAYDFYSQFNKYKSQGMSLTQIAEQLGCVNKYGDPSPTILKNRYSLALADVKNQEKFEAIRLYEEGKMSKTDIAAKLGVTEGTVRNWIKEQDQVKYDAARATANILKKYAEEHKYIDVGAGVNYYLNVNPNQMQKALEILKLEEGMKVQNVEINQLGTDYKTVLSVLTPGDISYSELMKNRFNIKGLDENGRVIDPNGIYDINIDKRPVPISKDRILISYADDPNDPLGGAKKDGLIELRPGVDDISMGTATFAQVRINVDDKYYLKGMAVYNPDLPDGCDIRFNTNKTLGTPFEKVVKSLKTVSEDDPSVDWTNPFGATFDQKEYIGADGKKHFSAVNIVNEEGKWQDWSKNTPSQFLSKQSKALAEQQLNQAYLGDKEEFEKIKSLTNNTLKRELLLQYADGCDKNAVDLKAAPFPKQQTHVLIPVPELKDSEIYAPNYENGTTVALIRYPHGGTFEIPILTVRNTGSPAKKIIGQAPDAVGINQKVAERLSGADFDGDTVTIIPFSNSVQIKSTPKLHDLEGFDTKTAYPKYPGMTVISNEQKQREMGVVTNLITDMTIKGASPSEIARAVKCSMVIIDSEKHELDWRRCYKECRIDELKERYQTDPTTGKHGASTIISRAKNEFDVPERDKSTTPRIDPETGNVLYKETGKTYLQGKLRNRVIDNGEVIFTTARTEKDTGRLYYTKDDPSTGKKVRTYISPDQYIKGDTVYVNKEKDTGRYYISRQDQTTGKYVRQYVTEADFNEKGIQVKGKIQKSTQMAETTDPYTLTSGGSKEKTKYPMELVYAKYASQEKELARQARLLYLKTPESEYSPTAAKKYATELASLDHKLRAVEMNRPKERQAQIIANNMLYSAKKTKGKMDKETLQKYKNRYIDVARVFTQSKKREKLIKLSDNEWEAIQAGAVRSTKLKTIFQNCDQDVLKQRALPRQRRELTTTQKALVKSLRAGGYEANEIAERLGISASYVYQIAHE